MPDGLHLQSIEALGPLLAARKLSPIELIQATLARIDQLDGTLQTFAVVAEDALDQARAAEAEIAAGRYRGPLHGVPIAVKDNYLTADMPTLAGTAAPGVSFPNRDSAAVARLRAAGAIVLGKTRMHEYAWGNVTPPTRNPWDTARVPGGSSGGSGAAVAARLCPVALGSDTGGSIRIPASVCGVVGLKPTFGRVSRAGIVPHSWSLDHAGPLSATVADSALVLQALAGADPADPGAATIPVPDFSAGLGTPAKGLRIGVVRNHFFGRNQPDVEAAVEAALAFYAAEGAAISDAALPILEYGLAAIFAIELSSSTAYHAANLASGAVAAFTPDVRLLVEMGRLVTGPDYLKAEQLRRVLMRDVSRLFEDVDVIVGPTCPLTAWRIGEWSVEVGREPESVLAASWRLTYPWNLAGIPSISVPCGFDREGLPIGLQIAGKPFDEATVIRAAHAYEQAHPWKDRVPNLG
jgi:aspartyl-tRNA(Asn)/glutamyl-tRNA(Gln) amidotransferase subunit A